MAATNSFIEGREPEDVKARQDFFMTLYSELGSIRAAAREMGINRKTVNRWIKVTFRVSRRDLRNPSTISGKCYRT